jgi:sialate O-acetylesterase
MKSLLCLTSVFSLVLLTASSAQLSVDPVIGKAAPDSTVSVTLGEEDRRTKATAEGNWQVTFAAMSARDYALELRVESKGQEIVFRDLVLGDVWLCAGQSNMEFPLSRDRNGTTTLASPLSQDLRFFQASYTATGAGGSWNSKTVAGLEVSSFMKGKWQPCSTASLPSMSAVAFFFGAALHQEQKVPIGLIDVAAGGTPIEAWIAPEDLAAHSQMRDLVKAGSWLENPLLGDWCRERASQNLGRAIAAKEDIPGDALGPNHAFKPGFMWTAATKRFTRLQIRGFLWYQGESNAESPRRVEQHRHLFALLVNSWRKHWGGEPLPFFFVQLPAMGRADWPDFREQQREFSQQLENVGMAVTIDVGHPADVHPRDKRPVGQRLAKLAQHLVYGETSPCTGPVLMKIEREADHLQLFFKNCAAGLSTVAQEAPQGFELVNADGKVIPVPAVIEQNAVRLSIPAGATVTEVRYAWAPVPSCNLIDSNGLPASPFRASIAP